MEEQLLLTSENIYRTHIKIVCDGCQNDFWRIKKDYNEGGKNFHTKKCRQDFQARNGRVSLVCGWCGIEFTRSKAHSQNSKSGLFFCSKEHMDLSRTKEKLNCINCNKIIDGDSEKYCSGDCGKNYRYNSYITRWMLGQETGNYGNDAMSVSSYIRRWLLEKNNNSCQKCGWSEINITSGSIPLEIHHIDGNWKNTVPENLELLCPNCHSLTPNKGSLNYGNGRNYRRTGD